jgi:hypothetical protein
MTNERAAIIVLALLIVVVVVGFKWVKKDKDE